VGLLGLGVSTLEAAQGYFNGFASGALLACAAYLMLIESMHMTSMGWPESEIESTWRWGTAFLGGFFLPIFFTAMSEFGGIDLVRYARGKVSNNDAARKCVFKFFRCPVASEKATDAPCSGELEIQPVDVEKQAGREELALSTLVALCIGDFFHNFVDGILIGAAFKQCDSSVAWGMVAASAGHEVAQELGDFIMYTSHPLSLPWHRAILINFCVGLTCVIGGILMTGIDVSESVLGLILAAGAGSYVYIGATVSLPAAVAGAYKAAGGSIDEHGHAHGKGTNLNAAKHLLLVLLSCIVGAVAIGLILLKHSHCVAAVEAVVASGGAVADPHAGHNHG
jgi:zinc transporter ZupT